MAVKTKLTFGGRVYETRALGSNLSGNNTSTIPWNQLFVDVNLHGGSTPDIDDVWHNRVALSAGTITLALDALPVTGMTAKDWTGKRVIAWAIRNNGANSMTFAGAGTNPYELFGGATGELIAPSGGIFQGHSPTGFGTISGTVSDITVTGTGTQTFDMLLFAGTP